MLPLSKASVWFCYEIMIRLSRTPESKLYSVQLNHQGRNANGDFSNVWNPGIKKKIQNFMFNITFLLAQSDKYV